MGEHVSITTVQDKITSSTVVNTINEVFVVDQIIITNGIPDHKEIATCRTESEGILRVYFHLGRKAWHLEREDKNPLFNSPMTLADALAKFEKMVGVELPSIPVIQYGVGISDAKDKYVNLNNPWQLEVDRTYQILDDRLGTAIEFVTTLRDGKVMISFVDEGTNTPDLALKDPAYALSAKQWEYLRITALGGERKPNFRP